MNALLSNVISIAKQAGKQLLSHYHSDFTVEYKADKSPVTAADRTTHTAICEGLNHLTPEIPILSEELTTIDFAERQHWQQYWLIDPLDGTKEFLDKNGEFTVNIALIENHEPLLGVIYAPAFDCCYFAAIRQGAFKQVAEQDAVLLQTAAWEKNSTIVMAISRRHGIDTLQSFFTLFPALSLIRCGSALKFCWLAEGFVDVYPRFSPTSEWDTAAGQCILKEAGGTIIDPQGQILRYNTKPSLHNTAFLAVGDKSHAWTHFF
jgi:3'(2'), 5'-bisphosphate nucleotidase